MFVYLLTSWCEWLALKIKIKERERDWKKRLSKHSSKITIEAK